MIAIHCMLTFIEVEFLDTYLPCQNVTHLHAGFPLLFQGSMYNTLQPTSLLFTLQFIVLVGVALSLRCSNGQKMETDLEKTTNTVAFSSTTRHKAYALPAGARQMHVRLRDLERKCLQRAIDNEMRYYKSSLHTFLSG